MDTSSADQARPGLRWQRRPRLPSARWRAVLLAVAAGLFAVEQVWFVLSTGPESRGVLHTPGAHAAPARHATLTRRVSALVADALGPSDRGVRRFQLTSLRADPAHHGLRILTLTWAINGDLSLGSVSAGAQLDVYLVLRTLYTGHLPLSMVRMAGTFGDRDKHGHHLEVPVMVVGMDAATARLIDWQDMDASSVWPLVHRYMMRPGFECQCQE